MALVVTGLAELQADLARAATVASVRPIMARAGAALEARMEREAAGRESAPGLPSAITRSVTHGGFGVEVGPRRGGAGSLAFKYYGNSKVNAVIPDPIIALHDEADKAVALIAASALDALSS